jgi:membrane protein implicated in regulation of membrane protease activity
MTLLMLTALMGAATLVVGRLAVLSGAPMPWNMVIVLVMIFVAYCAAAASNWREESKDD